MEVTVSPLPRDVSSKEVRLCGAPRSVKPSSHTGAVHLSLISEGEDTVPARLFSTDRLTAGLQRTGAVRPAVSVVTRQVVATTTNKIRNSPAQKFLVFFTSSFWYLHYYNLKTFALIVLKFDFGTKKSRP